MKFFKLNYLLIPLITFLTAFLGGLITGGGMAWYKSIKLPAFTPGGGVIGAVWTGLFILSAISAILVWNSSLRSEQAVRWKWIIAIFIANALLNIFWSWLFFGQHQIGWAIWEAGLLDLSVWLLIILIWPVSGLAAALLLPYGVWAAFATFLTYSVWKLN